MNEQAWEEEFNRRFFHEEKDGFGGKVLMPIETPELCWVIKDFIKKLITNKQMNYELCNNIIHASDGMKCMNTKPCPIHPESWEIRLGNNWHQLATDDRAKTGGCECGVEKGFCGVRLNSFIKELLASEKEKIKKEIQSLSIERENK